MEKFDQSESNIDANFSLRVDLQNPNEFQSLPDLSEIQSWCQAAVQSSTKKKAFENSLSVLIRIVDENESADLNQTYREKVGPTNVLSFPNEVPEFMLDIADLIEQNSHLGDLVICEPLMHKEATEQGKSVTSHWAHLIIHGVLHLQGFDHIDEAEAFEMETLEISILEQLGFVNPYIK